MIGFSIMMWFVSIFLLFVSISLLKGNYSSMHGKVFNNTNDKIGYAKASGKPVLFMAIGIAVSGVVAVATSKIIISVVLLVCVAIIMGIWFINIQKDFHKSQFVDKRIAMLKKYRLGFDIFGLLLFLSVMIPNFIWFAVPAPNDVLRVESITPIIDGIGSVAQVVFIAAIFILIRKDVDKIRFSKLIILSLAMVITYFVGWILYYNGMVNPIVIVLLTIPPCMAFVIYTVDRKNVIAMIPAIIFTVCHVIYGTVNYII